MTKNINSGIGTPWGYALRFLSSEVDRIAFMMKKTLFVLPLVLEVCLVAACLGGFLHRARHDSVLINMLEPMIASLFQDASSQPIHVTGLLLGGFVGLFDMVK